MSVYLCADPNEHPDQVGLNMFFIPAAVSETNRNLQLAAVLLS